MEIIKKQISLDACRSHKQGLLPFIHSISGCMIEETSIENNNYGHFVCDLSGTTGIIKYLDIIDKYNKIREILRLAHYCKCISLKDGSIALKICSYNNINNSDVKCDDICDDRKKPFEYQPLSKNFILIDENTFIPQNQENLIIGEFYILINDFNFYQNCESWAKANKIASNKLGNFFQFMQYVDENIINSNKATNIFKPVSPYVELPILFEEEYINDTLYYPYEYSVSGTEIETITISGITFSAIVGTEIVNIEVENEDEVSINKQFISGITVESKLHKLIHPSSISIADGYVGFLESWEKDFEGNAETEAGAIFECVFHHEQSWYTPKITLVGNNIYQIIFHNKEEDNHVYEWWECRLIDDETGFECYEGDADDFVELNYRENVDNNSIPKYYQKITILSCLKNYITAPIDGDVYYFKARYKNGKMLFGKGEESSRKIDDFDTIKKLTIPFRIGEPINIESYEDVEIYDKILNVSLVNNNLRFTYVIGATSGKPDTGIIYTETLRFNNSEYAENIWIDGVINGDLYYQMIDYDTNIKYYFNEDYGVSSAVREAKIINMETNNFKTYKYPLITRDGTEKMFFEPKIMTDIIFDRGNAAGWEKHFKLSECNTMKDLENYGNNIFNL